MKIQIALALLFSVTALAQDTFRTFTVSDGRTLKAKILSYDERKEQVQIQREDKQKLTVSPTSFTEKDQTYIKKWYAAQVFMSPNLLKLELKRNESETTKKEHEVDMSQLNSGRRGGSGITQVAVDKRTPVKYDLTLKNASTAQLNNMMIEYRIYYDQQKPVLDEKANKNRPDDTDLPERYMAVDELKVKDGSARLKPAEPDSTRTVSTDSIILLNRAANRPYGDKITLKSNLHGVWVRLTMKGPDGEMLSRDIASSASIMKKFPWDLPEELAEQDKPAN